MELMREGTTLSITPNSGDSPDPDMTNLNETTELRKLKLAIDPFIILLFALIMLQTFGKFSSSFLISAVTLGGLLFLLKPMAEMVPDRPLVARAEVPLILLFAWGYISTLIAADPEFSLQ